MAGSRGKNVKTIVIGTGLTNEYLGTRHQFLSSRRNVGQYEITRLLGRGKSSEGPLSAFISNATAGNTAEVILLRPGAFEEESAYDPNALVTRLAPVESHAIVLEIEQDALPWKRLLEVISSATGDGEPGPETDARVVVVGTHTETQVLSIAGFLRQTLGMRSVAVCSHLVGSSTLEAHLSMLRYMLPSLGVEVFVDLEELAAWAGLDRNSFADTGARPCRIEPPEAAESMTDAQRKIIQMLCLHWTRARVRPLAGGFSGSLLLLANGWKGEAVTEPMVLKIDSFSQMRRELDGYYQIKDFFGKHVPTFGFPVSQDELLGVGMELAAMEGLPETLQRHFEKAETEIDVNRFLDRFQKALSLLSSKVYVNTLEWSWVVPYRAFGLHAERQLEWLERNAEIILSYLAEEGGEDSHIDPGYLGTMLKLIARNEDAVETEICVEHGDLNFANVLCDEGDNIWFIDWTHSGLHPIERDFAKLENDVKFVLSKEFDLDDLPRLRIFEEFLLTHRIPPDVDGLPETLKFAKWDLRFRKILSAVRRTREACFALKETDEDWLVYRIALLRYATHTLSFDRRRGRGECDLAQLMYALYSVEHLTFILVADDYHLKIRAERPPSYPVRQRILIDSAPWPLESEGYEPPYYVDPLVLENDRTVNEEGWADPEDFMRIPDLEARPAKWRDDQGRPLNPRGRTGIAGRGALGMWGRNLSVVVVVIRTSGADELEILLGQTAASGELAIPRSFVRPGESVDDCLRRTLETETGWGPGDVTGETFFDAYTYDARQTDHSWVEAKGFVLFDDDDSFPAAFEPKAEFEEVKWLPLSAETVNRVSAASARFVRDAVRHLVEKETIDSNTGNALLQATG